MLNDHYGRTASRRRLLTRSLVAAILTPGRTASRRQLRMRGLIAVILLLCIGLVLTRYARGDFEDSFRVTVMADTIGDGLVTGADVKLNGFAIGRVAEIENSGFGHQRIELKLDRDQVGQLTDKVRARFASTTMFGSTGVELLNIGGGAPLEEGATLRIGADSTQATVTDALSKLSRIAGVLSDDDTLELLRFLTAETQGVGTTISALLGAARMLRDGQRGSLRKYLAVGAEMSSGVAEVTPLVVGGVVDLIAQAEFFGSEANRTKVNTAISGLNERLLRDGGDVLAAHQQELVDVVDVAMDLVIPIGMSLGTIAPAYGRLPGLIANIRGAFPEVAGRPQLQLELVAARFPQVLTSALARADGGEPTPAAPGGGR